MEKKGFVYVLTSPNSDFIKIGGTEQSIAERIRGINGSPEYGADGPWALSDFLHVYNWRLVERKNHSHFKKHQQKSKYGARELFRLPALEARKQLLKTLPTHRIGYLEKTSRLGKNHDLEVYLYELLDLTGLYGQYDIQGAWTLSIFPATGRNGRYFTINIGRHEVAFSTLPAKGEKEGFHVLIMDDLIKEYPRTIQKIRKHRGQVKKVHYKSAGERAVSVSFFGDLALAQEILTLPGVSRAMIAYWHDRLATMRKSSKKSFFARFHDYDAAYELLNFKRDRENVFSKEKKEIETYKKMQASKILTNPHPPLPPLQKKNSLLHVIELFGKEFVEETFGKKHVADILNMSKTK